MFKQIGRSINDGRRGIVRANFDELPPFVHDHAPLQTFYHYGDRKDYAHLSDEQWSKLLGIRFKTV